MKTHSRRSYAKFLFAMYALTSLLFAIYPQSVVAQTNTFPQSGNVGIGTTSPTAKLHVWGSGNIQSVFESTTAASELGIVSSAAGSGSWSIGTGWASSGALRNLYFYDNVAAAIRLLINSSGNVGIGANGPSKKLVIQSDAANDHLSIVRPTTNAAILNIGIDNTGPFFESTTINRPISFYTHNGTSIAERMRLDANGNVGIGTASPAYKLDLTGNTQWVARFRKTDATHGGVIIEALSGYNPNLALAVSGVIKWHMNSNSSSGDALQFWETGGNFPRFTLTQAGNVGIGTPNPGSGYRLDVQGGAINSSGGLCMAGDCKTAWSQVEGASHWSTSDSNVYYNAGNVGIGTASPSSPLFVVGNEPSNDFATLRVKPSVTHGGIVIDSASNYTQAHLRFYRNGTPRWQFRVPFQDNVEDLRLYSWAAGADVLSVSPGGNVGIGITSPAAKLDVNGNAKISGNIEVTGTGNITAEGTIEAGNIKAKYQDVAEWVPSTRALLAGTVVTLDPTKSNHVEASSKAYDTRVAGVVSAQPGIALGEGGEGKVLVATTGRVRIKVDASTSPIHVGDLLVTSSVPGVAMKSQPIDVGGVGIHRPGTLIGKALEPLAKGQGEILVLLSLQ